MFKVETNVEIPPSRVRDGVATEIRETLPTMVVGDSFFVPISSMKPSTVRVTVSKEKRKLAPKDFTARAVQNGSRVWRTA